MTGRSGPRLIDAMPRPLLVLFAAAAVAALVAVAALLVSPPGRDDVPVAERRPPPRGPYSHDVGDLVPAPLPTAVPTVEPPCEAVRGVRLIGGGDALRRLNAALTRACGLVGAGEEVDRAVRALAGATVRFGIFDRSGVESTVEFGARTVWLNAKFAVRKVPVSHIVPVLVHDAWHLANPSEPVSAAQELAARRVEATACRGLIAPDDRPRWCEDADALARLPEARAIERLVAAGYSP